VAAIRSAILQGPSAASRRRFVSAESGIRSVRRAALEDVFAAAVCALAGEAFERSIGLSVLGGRADLERADELLKTVVSGQALNEAAAVVEEAAISLVESERFQRMAFALAPVITKERYVGAKQIRRILEEADPDRDTHARELHSVETLQGPWFRVTQDGRVVYRGASQREAYAAQRSSPGSTLVGSSI